MVAGTPFPMQVLAAPCTACIKYTCFKMLQPTLKLMTSNFGSLRLMACLAQRKKITSRLTWAALADWRGLPVKCTDCCVYGASSLETSLAIPPVGG